MRQPAEAEDDQPWPGDAVLIGLKEKIRELKCPLMRFDEHPGDIRVPDIDDGQIHGMCEDENQCDDRWKRCGYIPEQLKAS